MMHTDPDLDALHHFWFGDLGPNGEVAPERQRRWFTRDPDFDLALRDRFGDAARRAAEGLLDAWAQTPRGLLGLILLLDQLPRNLYRGDARAFAQDARARDLSARALDSGAHLHLTTHERAFAYMPLMHSEDLRDQERCVAAFEALRDALHGDLRAHADNNLRFAIQHRDIIARWGRFPHRNEALGRPSTPEERAFLQTPGSSF